MSKEFYQRQADNVQEINDAFEKAGIAGSGAKSLLCYEDCRYAKKPAKRCRQSSNHRRCTDLGEDVFINSTSCERGR